MLTIARKSTLEIVPADEEDARTLERLIDLYCYDYSEFDEADVLDSGSYEYIDVAQYVKKKTNYPHFIKYNGKYAGFALIQKITDETGTFWYLQDYFIMRKYRQYGLGRKVATRLFDSLQGEWEVRQDATNVPAQKFWKKVIGTYTNEQYRSITRKKWDGPIQRFNSGDFYDEDRLQVI